MKGYVVRKGRAPKRRRPSAPLRAWNVEQLQTFLAAARSKRLFPTYWVAATTGMRRSELLGLRWGDIDLGAGRVSISRALVSVGYVLHDSPGKTRMSQGGPITGKRGGPMPLAKPAASWSHVAGK